MAALKGAGKAVKGSPSSSALASMIIYSAMSLAEILVVGASSQIHSISVPVYSPLSSALAVFVVPSLIGFPFAESAVMSLSSQSSRYTSVARVRPSDQASMAPVELSVTKASMAAIASSIGV